MLTKGQAILDVKHIGEKRRWSYLHFAWSWEPRKTCLLFWPCACWRKHKDWRSQRWWKHVKSSRWRIRRTRKSFWWRGPRHKWTPGRHCSRSSARLARKWAVGIQGRSSWWTAQALPSRCCIHAWRHSYTSETSLASDLSIDNSHATRWTFTWLNS